MALQVLVKINIESEVPVQIDIHVGNLFSQLVILKHLATDYFHLGEKFYMVRNSGC